MGCAFSRSIARCRSPDILPLGSCHAWLSSGGKPRDETEIIQECGAGLVPLRNSDHGFAFAAPPLVRGGPVDEASIEELAAFLRIDRVQVIDAQWADNGPGWVVVMLETAGAVLALEPARDHSGRLDLGVVGPYPAGGSIAFELRAFFTDHQGTIREDPVTGSLNASVAQWLLDSGRARCSVHRVAGNACGPQWSHLHQP